MSGYQLADLCTFRPYLGRGHRGAVCARPAADEAVHSGPDERKRLGTHIWRNDGIDALRGDRRVRRRKTPIRSTDYKRGYDSGYHAAVRAILDRENPA